LKLTLTKTCQAFAELGKYLDCQACIFLTTSMTRIRTRSSSTGRTL